MFPPVLFLSQLVMLVLPVGAVAFFGWLGLRYVRARERDAQTARSEPTRTQLGRIEEQLESLQSELRSLQERQTFVERLLERPRESR